MSANCAVAHPAAQLDRVPMHFRDHRIGAAEREQRHDRELHREREQDVGIGLHRRLHQASAMLSGASTSSTSSSGQRISPMATAVAISTNGAGPKLRNIGAAILATVAISRPGGGRRDARRARGARLRRRRSARRARRRRPSWQNGTSRKPDQAASAPVGAAHARAEHRR